MKAIEVFDQSPLFLIALRIRNPIKKKRVCLCKHAFFMVRLYLENQLAETGRFLRARLAEIFNSKPQSK
jgi:hypothetical protein